MEYRNLGHSGLKVPVLSFGTGTFGGQGPLFAAWGNSSSTEARRLIDLCLEAGGKLVCLARGYFKGGSGEELGSGVQGRPRRVLVLDTSSQPARERAGVDGSLPP